MPRYRVLAPAFLQPDRSAGASMQSAGAEISFSGAPGPSLQPLDDDGRALMAVELVAKGRPQHESAHMATHAWAKAIGVTPTSTAHAEQAITAFIAKYHPDPKTRERFA